MSTMSSSLGHGLCVPYITAGCAGSMLDPGPRWHGTGHYSTTAA